MTLAPHPKLVLCCQTAMGSIALVEHRTDYGSEPTLRVNAEGFAVTSVELRALADAAARWEAQRAHEVRAREVVS